MSRSQLLTRKDRGSLKIPSDSVIEICNKTEIEIKQAKGDRTFFTTNFLWYSIKIQRNLNPNVFSSLNKHICDQEPINNHKDILIKNIIKKYITTRVCHSVKNVNESLHIERIHSQNTRLTIFKNQ